MGRTKVERPRNPERGFLIDVESDGALKKMGFDDPGLAKRVLNEIRRRREVWGLQAIEIAIEIVPIEERGKTDRKEPEENPIEMEEVPEAGEISGWPLNSKYYPTGKGSEKKISGWPADPGRYDSDGSIIGEHKGMDIRGMVPGGIPGFKIDPVPENIPPSLNIP